MVRSDMSLRKRLELREIGRTSALSFRSSLRAPLHRSLQAVDIYDPEKNGGGGAGGIFGMDFNGDG